MTKQEIREYIVKNDYTVNPTVILSMIDSLDVPVVTLPDVNVTGDKLLLGASAINSNGEVVQGTCLYNAKVPTAPKTTKWVMKNELPEGTAAVIQVGTSWVLIQN